MKRVFIVLALCALVGTAAAQEVKIKRGKATMTEEQYNALKAKADAYDRSQAELAALRKQAAPARPKSFNDSASYAIGRDIYNQWASQNLGINGVMAGQAMIDCAKGQNLWSDQMSRPLLQRFQQDFERRQRDGVQANIKAGEKYLTEVSNNKSVYTTKSGLQYRKLREGNGKRPTATSKS